MQPIKDRFERAGRAGACGLKACVHVQPELALWVDLGPQQPGQNAAFGGADAVVELGRLELEDLQQHREPQPGRAGLMGRIYIFTVSP